MDTYLFCNDAPLTWLDVAIGLGPEADAEMREAEERRRGQPYWQDIVLPNGCVLGRGTDPQAAREDAKSYRETFARENPGYHPTALDPSGRMKKPA